MHNNTGYNATGGDSWYPELKHLDTYDYDFPKHHTTNNLPTYDDHKKISYKPIYTVVYKPVVIYKPLYVPVYKDYDHGKDHKEYGKKYGHEKHVSYKPQKNHVVKKYQPFVYHPYVKKDHDYNKDRYGSNNYLTPLVHYPKFYGNGNYGRDISIHTGNADAMVNVHNLASANYLR